MRVTKRFEGISFYRESKKSRWCVRISGRLTPSGKEQKKRFPDSDFAAQATETASPSQLAYAAAKQWAAKQETRKQEQGSVAFTLTPGQNLDAIAALKLLDGRASLVDAASELLRQRFPRGDKQLIGIAVQAYIEELTKLGRSPVYVAGLDDPLWALAQLCGAIRPEMSDENIRRRGGRRRYQVPPMAGGREKHVHEVTTADVEKFLACRKLSPNGYNHYVQDVARFFRWCERQAWTNTNPAARIPLKSEVPTEIGILTPLEALRLLTAAKERSGGQLLPFVVLGLYTGLRTAELHRLTWDRVLLDDDEPRVLLPARSAKDREFRGVDIPANAAEWLKMVPFKTGKVVPLSNPADSFTLLHKSCLGRPWPKNGLRHSRVSYTARLHGESKASEDAGHESVRMTRQRYKALVTKRQAQAYFSIYPETTPQELEVMLAIPSHDATRAASA
ncbi:hypothetical protein DB347_20720 [Opitutaceae bacterium EW11]|nr:hypothetical protein DB347_20720 [Opitutaceae bacterium EW11]